MEARQLCILKIPCLLLMTTYLRLMLRTCYLRIIFLMVCVEARQALPGGVFVTTDLRPGHAYLNRALKINL
uniref:Uncharacterized protein n=1 Tax=Anguilla anguilla TaxID=7936 RepID=A0A0E9QT68_ANGAN